MSDAIHDMAAYENLTDSVLWSILTSTAPELEASRTLLRVRGPCCCCCLLTVAHAHTYTLGVRCAHFSASSEGIAARRAVVRPPPARCCRLQARSHANRVNACPVTRVVPPRQLYPFVGETLLPSDSAKLTSAQLASIKTRLCALAPASANLKPLNLILHRVTMSYGTKLLAHLACCACELPGDPA